MTHPDHFDVQLDGVLLVVGLDVGVLLDGELGRLAVSPVPRRELFADLEQTGEPLLGRVDQLEAALEHHQLAPAVVQLSGRRPQKFIAETKATSYYSVFA